MATSAVAGLASIWLSPVEVAVIAVGAAVVAMIATPFVDRARLDSRTRPPRQRDLVQQVAGVSERGALRPARDWTDPIALGVHPAAPVGSGDRIPPFVRRDVDARLARVLARPGFVLLVGESTSGKTRAAYEAMHQYLPHHVLICPVSAKVIPGLAPLVAAQTRCVLWLDDLERYLGVGGLTSDLVIRMLGNRTRHVVLLATMRSQEHARYDRRRESGLDETGREVWRRGRDVIESANEIHLERIWSPAEITRAAAHLDDPRIAQALRQADRFGVAETLAAGPELVSTLRDAWSPGHRPRAAALVSAAVDCRRAGVHRPLPLGILGGIEETYLAARGGAVLRPEPPEQAIAFATTAVYATTSLLVPDGQGAYLAHDYLVDTLPTEPIPDATWQMLLDRVDASDAYDIGTTAMDAYRFDHARRAFGLAADAQVPNARYMLAFATGRAGRPGEAADLVKGVLEAQVDRLGIDHPDTMTKRADLASWTGEAGNHAGAVALFRALLADRTRVMGADHPDTLATRAALASWIGKAWTRKPEDADAAVAGFRDLLPDSIRVLGADHPITLGARAGMAYWTGQAGDPASAVYGFGQLVADLIRVLGADHVDTFAARHNLAFWTGEAGNAAHAATLFEDLVSDTARVLGPDHPDTLAARNNLAHWTALAGNIPGAVARFTDVLADRQRVLGPDHPATLITRQSLAHWIGEAGDPNAAVAGFRDLLADRARVLGADHHSTGDTRASLAYWTRQAQAAGKLE